MYMECMYVCSEHHDIVPDIYDLLNRATARYRFTGL